MSAVNRQHLFLGLISTVVFIVVVVATYNTLTRDYPGHNDFMSRWEGARSFWQDGLNPYGDEASLNIQERIYGRAVIEGEDPGLFVYPFYTAILIYPLVHMDYAWASAILMTLLEVCLLGGLFLLLSLFRWKPRPLLLGGLVAIAILAYYPARGLLLGQLGHAVYFLEVLTLWAIVRKHDDLAGVALAISTLKPQMGYLLVPFLLLWGLKQKRYVFVGSFVGMFAVLIIASFLFVPTWLGDWIDQVRLYPSYTEIGSPVWVVANFPWLSVDTITDKWVVNGGFGNIIEALINIGLYLFMIWSWYQVLIKHHWNRWLWTIVLTLTVTHLSAPRTATPHFVVFMIPFIFYMRELTKPKVRNGQLWAWVVIILTLIIPWVHFLTTIKGDFENPTLFVPAPFLVLILHWLTRNRWWNQPVSEMRERKV